MPPNIKIFCESHPNIVQAIKEYWIPILGLAVWTGLTFCKQHEKDAYDFQELIAAATASFIGISYITNNIFRIRKQNEQKNSLSEIIGKSQALQDAINNQQITANRHTTELAKLMEYQTGGAGFFCYYIANQPKSNTEAKSSEFDFVRRDKTKIPQRNVTATFFFNRNGARKINYGDILPVGQNEHQALDAKFGAIWAAEFPLPAPGKPNPHKDVSVAVLWQFSHQTYWQTISGRLLNISSDGGERYVWDLKFKTTRFDTDDSEHSVAVHEESNWPK